MYGCLDCEIWFDVNNTSCSCLFLIHTHRLIQSRGHKSIESKNVNTYKFIEIMMIAIACVCVRAFLFLLIRWWWWFFVDGNSLYFGCVVPMHGANRLCIVLNINVKFMRTSNEHHCYFIRLGVCFSSSSFF